MIESATKEHDMITIYHQKHIEGEPMWDPNDPEPAPWPDRYEKVATVDTENLAWAVLLSDDHRSSMVGDVLEQNGTLYIVLARGFEVLQDLNVKQPEQMYRSTRGEGSFYHGFVTGMWAAMDAGPAETAAFIERCKNRGWTRNEPGGGIIPPAPVAEHPREAFTATFCRWWHECTGEYWSPGLHHEAPQAMHDAAKAFEAGQRNKTQPAPGWRIYPVSESEPDGIYEIEHDSGELPPGEMNHERKREEALTRTWEIYESGWTA